MSQRTQSRIPGTSLLRGRAAVLALGLGVSAAVGTGAAVAADAASDVVALPAQAAASVQRQAAAQAKAAQAKSGAAESAAAKKAAASKTTNKAASKAATKTVNKAATKPAAAKSAASWVDPVKKYTLSASFAQAGKLWSSTHSGQDFAVSSGTPVVAAHGGTVVKAGGNGAGDGPAYGNAIVIKHGNGTYSQYAHLSRIDVRVGQTVGTGRRIALSGNTGNSSGPHLHFEIRTTAAYGTAVDPVAFLRSKGLSL